MREKIVKELKLQEIIKNTVNSVLEEVKQNRIIQLKEEKKLRNYIRNLIKEAYTLKERAEIPTHETTGINVLEDLLKKILPVIEIDYKTMTSSTEQRNSFRAHFINAVQNMFAPEKVMATDDPRADAINAQAGKEGEELKEINVNIGDESTDEISDDSSVKSSPVPETDPDSEDQFIDIKSKKYKKYNKLFNLSSVEEDDTGRNMAIRTFDKVGKNIFDSYSVLGEEEDKEMFYDYLIANLKLYCDKWDEELQITVPEPTNKEYEDEKDEEATDKAEGEMASKEL